MGEETTVPQERQVNRHPSRSLDEPFLPATKRNAPLRLPAYKWTMDFIVSGDLNYLQAKQFYYLHLDELFETSFTPITFINERSKCIKAEVNTTRRKAEGRAHEDEVPLSPSLASRTLCVLDLVPHGTWHRTGHKFTHSKELRGILGPRTLQMGGSQLSEAPSLGSPG